MLATVLVVWCVGSVLLAPLVGRAIRRNQQTPKTYAEAGCDPVTRKRGAVEVA